jgi:hypothetical protein
LSNKKSFYPAHQPAQLLLNTILAPWQCEMRAELVVNMQQLGAPIAGMGQARS